MATPRKKVFEVKKPEGDRVAELERRLDLVTARLLQLEQAFDRYRKNNSAALQAARMHVPIK